MTLTNLGASVLERTDILPDANPLASSAPSINMHLGAKILIVDDEPEILFAVGLRLRSAGYKTIAARDGLEATKLALHEKPDLIILDIGMPCGNGLMIAQRLANNVATVMVPVIFLTARTAVADRRAAMAVRAYDYITKPFTTARLLASVAGALDGLTPASELRKAA